MKYIPAFDGLRFFLTLGVYAYHFAYYYVEILWWTAYVLPVFFVLSGYLVTNLAEASQENNRLQNIFSFWKRRFFRILPTFFIGLLIIFLVTSNKEITWRWLFDLNLQVFFKTLPGYSNKSTWAFVEAWRSNQLHLWSLALEIQFYFLLPIFFYLTSGRLRVLLLVAFILSSIALRAYFVAKDGVVFYGALPFISGEYLAFGALFALMKDSELFLKVKSDNWITFGITILLFWLILFGRPSEFSSGIFKPNHTQTIIALGIALIIHGLTVDSDHFLSRLFSNPLFVYFGKTSYCVFLLHMLAIPIMSFFQAPRPSSILDFLILCVIAQTLGFALWITVDQNINKLRWRMR